MSIDSANKIQVTTLRLEKSTIFKCSYKWVISRFIDKKEREINQTSDFKIDDSSKTFFSLYMKRKDDSGAYFEICLNTRRRIYIYESQQYFLNTEFFILDSNDSKQHMTCSGIIPYSTCSSLSTLMTISEDTLLKNPELLPNDTLTILCNFQLMKPSEELYPANTTSSLSQDMKCLFEHRDNAEIVLQIGDESFKAHKLVLTTRSPVFAAMFQNEMEENKDNTVKITDITKDVLEEFLLYMYTDETPNLKTLGIGLLGAAEKYNVESLKRRCEKYFFTNATIEDSAEILINADLYNAEGLKKSVIQFINFHRKDFVKTEGYKMLRESNARLVFEIFEADTLF